MSIDWRRAFPILGGILLVLLYAWFYLSDPAAPGNSSDPCCLTGWIGWGDQGLYYRSAIALAAGNYDPGFHWYPLGYSLLAVPFSILGDYRFFLVDVVGLSGAYAAFVLFAVRVGVSATTAAVLFLLTSCADAFLFRQWAIPWNTTPAAAVIWGMLAVAAAYMQGDRRPFLLGFLAGALPLIRPTDGIVSTICLLWVAVDALSRRQLPWRDVAKALFGLLVPILLYAALYLRIYGPNMTQYMLNSRYVGFTLHNPVWRAYVLLIEPRQWFFEGRGLLARMPWLLLGFAGAVSVLRRGGPAALLSVCLIAYCGLFLAYVDLLPTGLWRYYNVHYFKWTLPGFGLLAWLLLGELFTRRRLAWGALAIVFALSCVRVSPRPANPAEPAVAVDIPGAAATEGNSTMNPSLTARDASGRLFNVNTMRAFPLPSGPGVRLIAIRRDLVGPVSWVPGHGLTMPADPPPQLRWAEQIGFGYPCWLPPHSCKKPARGS